MQTAGARVLRSTVPNASGAVAGRLAIVVAGAVSLAVAMGIGRFAFTPLLPMMLQSGSIDLAGASWLASLNYFGYLAGALLCTFEPWIRARTGAHLPPVDGPLLVRAGLVATGLLTLGMAVPVAALWPLWRFAAGVASAVVFVHTAGFCLNELARRDSAPLGAAIFTGPGAGIVVSGLFASAMVGWHWQAATAWAIHGVLALMLTAAVWRVFDGRRAASALVERTPTVAPATVASVTAANRRDAGDTPSAEDAERTLAAAWVPAVAARLPDRGEIACLALAYGLAGFGYIVTATFLPVIARVALPGSAWLDLFWPIFGAGVTTGALLATRLRIHGDLRPVLAGCYAVQALGIGASLWRPSLPGFAVGSLLLGLPFTAITFFAMQEVRRLRPTMTAPFMGLLTALYGVGQIVGPPLVALLLRLSVDAGAGFARSLEIAAGALVCGAALYLAMMRAYPLRRSAGA